VVEEQAIILGEAERVRQRVYGHSVWRSSRAAFDRPDRIDADAGTLRESLL
jgi:hypothetical protein